MASGVQLMLKLMNMSDEELGIRDEDELLSEGEKLGIRDEDELLSEGEKLGMRDVTSFHLMNS